MNKFKWNEVKEGQIVYHICLSRWGGRIWELKVEQVKIIKINDKSIRINFIEHNGGNGNEWAAKKEKLFDEEEAYFETITEGLNKLKEYLPNYAKKAEEQLSHYTENHPSYEWYEYTKNILADFTELCKNGWTKEKYMAVKKKYQPFEETQTKKIFGVK